eukprot:1355771-Amorphochlora_amoeboformis.AAC.1
MHKRRINLLRPVYRWLGLRLQLHVLALGPLTPPLSGLFCWERPQQICHVERVRVGVLHEINQAAYGQEYQQLADE